MPPTINNALVPQIIPQGLQFQIYQGSALINGSVIFFSTTVVGVLPNTTTWCFINISGGIIQTNNTGFPGNSYPIAVVQSTNTGIGTLVDSRPDYALISSSNVGIGGRFILNFGTNLIAGNFALSGWGAGASIGSISGKDSAHAFTVTAGSSPSVAPTVILTFADGAWNAAPLVFTQLLKGSGSLLPTTYTSTTTTYTLTFNGLPINGQTYMVSVIVCGLS
jgi:hypothetical protein